jgi:hypothetical protein
MKYYHSIQIINLPEEKIASAKTFSASVVPTTNYSDSNQFLISKIKDDHFISKLGEEAVKTVLSAYGEVRGPDYKIYSAKEKNWDDDLYVNNVGVAVKTQKRSTALRYGLSWTFQCSSTRKDIILNKPNAWVVFVEYDDLNPHTCYVYPPYQMHELILDEPKLDRLKGFKKVVYANTLGV